MFKASLYFVRVLIALFVGGIFCIGLYFAFDYFSPSSQGGSCRLSAFFGKVVSSSVSSVGSVLGQKTKEYLVMGKVLDVVSNLYRYVITQKSGSFSSSKESRDDAPVVLRAALVADSHQDNESLALALARAKELEADFVIHLGDLSRVGEYADLARAKEVLDQSNLPYYTIPGDHDRWDNRGKGYYEEVFGSPYQLINKSDTCFVLMDNSDIYHGINDSQLAWLHSLDLAKCANGLFVFCHIPLDHPSSTRKMGEKSAVVAQQAKDLLAYFSLANVDAVFSGDLHLEDYFIHEGTKIPFYISPALTREKNLSLPGIYLLVLKENGSWQVSNYHLAFDG